MPSTPPDTRASLILRLGDPSDVEAWHEFTEIYSPIVFRVALRHGLQSADAEDLVQEVSSSVARSVSRWLAREDRGSFRAWLFRIARNTAIDFLTRRKHQPWSSGGQSEWDFETLHQHTDDDILSDFEIEYRREVFQWASTKVRQSVSESTWQAFWLTSVEEVPVKQAAERLGLSAGGIYIARSRVMKRLRALVRQYEEVANADEL